MARARTPTEVLAPVGREAQPVSRVVWVHRSKLRANTWNPNRVAPPELYLLKVSILADGWTQPIVARPDGEIVDGYHRWNVSEDPQVYALTDGYIPVVYLQANEVSDLMMSTVRHNRARGTHYVARMADIVRDLIDAGVPKEQVMRRLQMEEEEVQRLYEHGNVLKHGAGAFGKGWVPQ